MAQQTPAQRRANAKFARVEEEKRGKAVTERVKREVQASPISKGWLWGLLFLVVGGVIFELLRIIL